MSAIRTQIYLTPDQRLWINELAGVQGVTMAEIVRRALDAYLLTGHADANATLARTFGAAPDAGYPDREGWDRGQRPG